MIRRLAICAIGSAACSTTVPAPPRIAIRAGPEAAQGLTTLSYRGGFEAKALVFETLVDRSEDGRIVPGLAESWVIEDGGKTFRFRLRDGIRAHDGTDLTADDVRIHFRRWVGLPEHDWLPASRAITSVESPDDRTLVVRLDRPRALLADLVAWNPCAIVAPGTLDREGRFTKPVGTGPFAFVVARERGRVLRLRSTSNAAVPIVDLVRYEAEAPDRALEDLLRGRIDVLADGWRERIPREALDELREDSRVRMVVSRGSFVIALGFRLEAGPCAREDVRLSIRDALDPAALIDRVEVGWAEPCRTLVAPCVATWPSAGIQASGPRPPARPDRPLVLLARTDPEQERSLAREIAAHLRAAGIAVEVSVLDADGYRLATEAADWDLRIERSYGMPYDPEISLGGRWLEPAAGRDARMAELVKQMLEEPFEERRHEVFALIQAEVDRRAPIIPLYVPHRVALVREEFEGLRIGPDPYTLHLDALRRSFAAELTSIRANP